MLLPSPGLQPFPFSQTCPAPTLDPKSPLQHNEQPHLKEEAEMVSEEPDDTKPFQNAQGEILVVMASFFFLFGSQSQQA